MDQRKIAETLGKVATKENVEKAISLIGISSPPAALVVGIVGALVVRAVKAANDYITDTDEIPLIPPLAPHRLTYNESIAFLEQYNLTASFQVDIRQSDPSTNPATYHIHEAIVQDAATFMRKATDGDDSIFKAFFYGYIRNNDLLPIWEERDRFILFRDKLKIAMPPARFTSMSRAMWNEMSGKESTDEIRTGLVDGLKEYLKDFVGDIDLDDLLKTIGLK